MSAGSIADVPELGAGQSCVSAGRGPSEVMPDPQSFFPGALANVALSFPRDTSKPPVLPMNQQAWGPGGSGPSSQTQSMFTLANCPPFEWRNDQTLVLYNKLPNNANRSINLSYLQVNLTTRGRHYLLSPGVHASP